jgi:penicillin-binding protein 1A
MAAKRNTARKEPQEEKAPQAPKKRGFRWGRFFLGLTVFFVLAGAAGGVGGYYYLMRKYGQDVPDITWAQSYRPPIVSNLVSGDNQLLAEFYKERRRVVPYERIPKKLVQAFVAAEDANFFDHAGIDFKGVVRAAIQNILSGRKKSGASTLTQQTAKAILISTWGFERGTEKTLRRKIAEAILARRLEEHFSKEQILNLYLNQVYLGHSSYGVQSAAENYFRKNVWDLTLGEMSLLAGLPQSPSRYSPFKHPDAAKHRRQYVLRRMLEEGMITKDEHDEAANEAVEVFKVEDTMHETAPFVSEHVRRDLVERYGNDRLLTEGLTVSTTVDLDMEHMATDASIRGVIEVDKRQGYRGPLTKVDAKTSLHPGSRGYDLAFRKAIAAFRKLEREKGAAPDWASALSEDATYVGVVLEVTKDGATIGVGDRIEGYLPLEKMKWARKPNPEVNAQNFPGVDAATKVLSVGDVILVKPLSADDRKALKTKESVGVAFSLEQEPSLQDALVSMDPKSGYILAMIGGYDFNKSEFNRAFQACRQPGSAFKPIVYSAAMEKIGYTPATILLDAPIVFDDPTSAVRWKPSNFEPEFKGEVTLRDALINSMNIPAVRTLEAVGVRDVADWAHRLGISTKLNEDLSIALGSSCVYLWDLTQVYALLNQGGKRVHPTFIRRVVDRDGHVLEDHSAYYDPWTSLKSRISAGYAALFQEREQVMSAQTAFVTTHLMEEVCRYGTAAHAASMGRNVAGKTGTTNDLYDAWFMGYSPDLVTGVWVGFDTYEAPMDRYETGGHTALPIWMDFMSAALKGRPNKAFPQPDGIVWVPIDPKTGQRAKEGAENAALEAFKAGTEPTAEAAAAATTPTGTGEFFRNQDL